MPRCSLITVTPNKALVVYLCPPTSESFCTFCFFGNAANYHKTNYNNFKNLAPQLQHVERLSGWRSKRCTTATFLFLCESLRRGGFPFPLARSRTPLLPSLSLCPVQDVALLEEVRNVEVLLCQGDTRGPVAGVRAGTHWKASVVNLRHFVAGSAVTLDSP